MKYIKNLLTIGFSYVFLITPFLVSAQSEGIAGKLIICNKTAEDVKTNSQNACDFNDLIVVANLLINVLITLALSVTVLVLLITGAKYLVAGSSDSKQVAKEAFVNLAKGFAFILGAYLIVNTLFAIAGVDTAFKLL